MAILSTYKNEIGIALCLSEKWPKEQRELLILEAKAMRAGREKKERLLKELEKSDKEPIKKEK